MSIVGRRVLAQFKNEEGSLVGTPFDLPLETDQESLLVLCNALLENVKKLIFNDIFFRPKKYCGDKLLFVLI